MPKNPIYAREVADAVESRMGDKIVEAMGEHGWNAFGVYEVVKDELKKRKKALKSSGCTPKQSAPGGGGSDGHRDTTAPGGV